MVAYLCSRDDRSTRLDWDGAVTSAAATVRRTGARASMPPPSGHPSARSAEPGEDWSWCYVDEVAFVVRS